jgi:glycine/D-amino acid oxidase-like deaminating enzyme
VDLAEATTVEPELAPAQPAEIELIVYDGAWYQPRKLARTALAAAQRLGATLHENDPVVDIRRVGGRAERVRTATGLTWSPDAVIDCAGAAADRVARLAGAQLPVEAVPGLVVTTAPSANRRLRSIVMGARANARPAGGMRQLLHSYEVDARLRLLPSGAQLQTLGARVLAEVAAVLPGLRQATIERVAVGTRPVPFDGFPLVGRVDDLDNFYAVVTHSGALLAPRLATLFTRELLAQSPRPELARFRPTRVREPAGPGR